MVGEAGEVGPWEEVYRGRGPMIDLAGSEHGPCYTMFQRWELVGGSAFTRPFLIARTKVEGRECTDKELTRQMVLAELFVTPDRG